MSSPALAPLVTKTATVVVSVIFPVLSLLAIIFRYKARRAGRQRLQADDWWIVVTWVVTFGLSITIWVFGALAGVDFLKGDPLVSLPLSNLSLWIQALLLQVCLATVKISILCFYKRIFFVSRLRRAADVGIAIIAIWGVVYFFLIMFQNNPITGWWTGQGHPVIDSIKISLSQAGTSIGLDFLVLCFPIPVISRLHMETKRKVAVMMIFWLGGFCCVAAIIRLVYMTQGEATGTVSRFNGGDTALANDAKSAVFITIEPNSSIIAACLPCYGPLLKQGRALDSPVRSIRSVPLLGSRKSGSASLRGSSRSPKTSQPTYYPSSSGDSQIELHKASKDWTSSQLQGQNIVHAEPLPRSVNETEDHLDHGIEVTRFYVYQSEQV